MSCAARFTPWTRSPSDRAPKLHVSRWAKGGPIEEMEKGKVYIVEFWATWCGPCVAAMPHLAQLQEKYRDKGAHRPRDERLGRDLSKVDPFVEKMGNEMDYAVAIDEYEGEPQIGRGGTADAWTCHHVVPSAC